MRQPSSCFPPSCFVPVTVSLVRAVAWRGDRHEATGHLAPTPPDLAERDAPPGPSCPSHAAVFASARRPGQALHEPLRRALELPQASVGTEAVLNLFPLDP